MATQFDILSAFLIAQSEIGIPVQFARQSNLYFQVFTFLSGMAVDAIQRRDLSELRGVLEERMAHGANAVERAVAATFYNGILVQHGGGKRGGKHGKAVAPVRRPATTTATRSDDIEQQDQELEVHEKRRKDIKKGQTIASKMRYSDEAIPVVITSKAGSTRLIASGLDGMRYTGKIEGSMSRDAKVIRKGDIAMVLPGTLSSKSKSTYINSRFIRVFNSGEERSAQHVVGPEVFDSLKALVIDESVAGPDDVGSHLLFDIESF